MFGDHYNPRLLTPLSLAPSSVARQEEKGTTEDEMVGWHH